MKKSRIGVEQQATVIMSVMLVTIFLSGAFCSISPFLDSAIFFTFSSRILAWSFLFCLRIFIYGTSHVALSGFLVIVPNLYAVRFLQDALLSRLLKLPPIVLRMLAMQVFNRRFQLRVHSNLKVTTSHRFPGRATRYGP